MNTKFLTKTLVLGIFSVVGFFSFVSIANAKFDVSVDRTYEMTADGRMLVEEVHVIKNNTEKSYIPSTESMVFQILAFKSDDPGSQKILQTASNSAVVKEGGYTYKIKPEISNNSVIIKVPYGKDLLPGDSRRFIFTYEHPGLISKNGALIDGYIHAFAPDFKFENDISNYTFTTKLVHSDLLPKLNFVNPEPEKIVNENHKWIYSFSTKSLINHFVWLQLGRSQIYDFVITQDIVPTDGFVTGLLNRYEVILPRDFDGPEITQKVYFRDIEPSPMGVYFDEEHNLIGVFEFNSDKTEQVKISGYAMVEKKEDIDLPKDVGNITDLPQNVINSNTSPAKYWEVDSMDIKSKANEIANGETNVYKITDAVYSFVVNSIDYSQVKRFGLNERQGALATLHGGAAVCMEYSDLFLTLMRAKGIPTRAVFGYGYDPRVSQDKQEAHQWVQVFMPGLPHEWVDVDVTWGESGDKLIGGDLNHFYTHVATKSPNDPPMVSRFAYGNSNNLTAPKFEIKTVELIPTDLRLLSTPDGLVSIYPFKSETETNFLVRQIKNIYTSGFDSLKSGVNFHNSAQIVVLVTIVVAGMLVGGIVEAILHSKKRKLPVDDHKDEVLWG